MWNYLKVVGSEFPVVELTATGKRALAHREVIDLDMPASATRTKGGRSVSAEPLEEDDEALLANLKSWRTEMAREHSVPPYVVFNDKTLVAIALARPQTDDDLLAVSGIGPSKLERYGEAVLELVAEAS